MPQSPSGMFRRSATDSACAPRPSALASVTAAGPMRRRLSESQAPVVVRFMKSSKPRPEEKGSEERRVGEEGVRPCRSRLAPFHYKKQDKKTTRETGKIT